MHYVDLLPGTLTKPFGGYEQWVLSMQCLQFATFRNAYNIFSAGTAGHSVNWKAEMFDHGSTDFVGTEWRIALGHGKVQHSNPMG